MDRKLENIKKNCKSILSLIESIEKDFFKIQNIKSAPYYTIYGTKEEQQRDIDDIKDLMEIKKAQLTLIQERLCKI